MASSADVRSGAVRRVNLDGVRHVGLFVYEDRVHALEDSCPHWGVPLTEGTVQSDGTVECSLHAWCFDLRTGRGTEPSFDRVEAYDVEEREGSVYVAPREEG